MTSLLDAPRRSPAPPGRAAGTLGVAAVLAAAAVVLRLPLLEAPTRPDEAGYLVVARYAHSGGPFLYGDLWVDRPPLLIALFRAADALGGVSALRLLGTAAVVVLVVGAVDAGWTLGGPRGGRWAGVVAASLASTPMLGAPEVDGELLAAPLVVLSAAAGLRALSPRPAAGPLRSEPAGLVLAGALGACALLVKQNFADALVLLLGHVVVLAVHREVSPRRAGRAVAALALGAALPLGAAVVWSSTGSTGPPGLWDALFGFRSASLRVIAAGSGGAPQHRALVLLLVAAASGLAPLLVTSWVAGRRALRHGEPAQVAVALMVAAGLPAIALGGSYWTHYLLELVPATALAAALLATRVHVASHRAAAGLVTLVVASAVASASVVATGALARPAPAAAHVGTCDAGRGATAVGHWIAASADRGDTVLTLYGNATVVEASGLRPAYPYLWSLPVRTLDPQLQRLTAALQGPGAAVWVVAVLPLHSWGLDAGRRLETALGRSYRPIGAVCGDEVYLRDGLARTPASSSR